jgi:hypothetical protein
VGSPQRPISEVFFQPSIRKQPISDKADGIMSGMALIWAANVKGLKPAVKIVLILLADFHNKETGQCNPSAKRLADDCEMGRATLFRHMTTL